MDDFKAVYRIFKLLDACLDFDESSPEACGAERLGIAEDRRENPLWMMRLECLHNNLIISKVVRCQGHRWVNLIAIWL